MTSSKSKSAAYMVGYGKPPLHARFRKGQSGNPGGRPRRPATERAKALREAYRRITLKEGGRAVGLPAIRAILRSQIGLAARGNVQAQRAVLAAIQTIEEENVEVERAAERKTEAERDARAMVLSMKRENWRRPGPAPRMPTIHELTQAAPRIVPLLRLAEEEQKRNSERRAPRAHGNASGAACRSRAAMTCSAFQISCSVQQIPCSMSNRESFATP